MKIQRLFLRCIDKQCLTLSSSSIDQSQFFLVIATVDFQIETVFHSEAILIDQARKLRIEKSSSDIIIW